MNLCLRTAPMGDSTLTVEQASYVGQPPAQLNTDRFVEIDLVISGRGIHRISDQTVPCGEGDICVLTQGVSHEYGAEGPGEVPSVCRIRFDPAVYLSGEEGTAEHPRFCFGVFCEGESYSYATLNKKTREEIDPLFRGIAREAEKERTDRISAVRAYLSALLIILSRYMNGALRAPSEVSRKERSLMSAALRIVSEEFASPALTLDTVSAELFVSASQLSRCFKHCVGKTFSDYLREVRMEHACRLLKETEQTVDQILTACGLRDLQSFYRGFHLYANMTPSQYRKKYNNQFYKSKGEKIMIVLSEISENLQKGKSKLVAEMVQQAIDEGAEPAKILNEGLLSGMSIIGEKFKNNEVYVPEVLVAARAMNKGLAILKPHLISSGVEAVGKVCIGTVQGDLHDIGKNIVKMMLEGKGLEVVDLGVDVPAETFVQTAKEQGCQVICCSALLTTTMDVMAEVVKTAEAAGIRDQVKIMIGGAPINEEFCKAIGADCYTVDAASAADAAVELCKSLL